MAKLGRINYESILEEIKLIPNTENHFVSRKGNVYLKTTNGLYLKKKLLQAKTGYVYVGIRYLGETTNRNIRVHRAVAQCFVENKNPDAYTIVGHMDNVKCNNIDTNLYWTDIKENTQKAVDDGLMVNKKGIHDSQSKPLAIYSNEHSLIGVYGSIRSADRHIDGFNTSSIAKIVDNTKKGLKGYYFRSITPEFFNLHKEFQNINLTVPYFKKEMVDFHVFKNNKYLFSSDNQTKVGKLLGVSQSNISRLLSKPEGLGIYKEYLFTRQLDVSNDYRKLNSYREDTR